MPVTTKTFRDQNKLHIFFAVSSLLLALCVIVAVIQDWANEYRKPQVELVRWDAAMTHWDKRVADLHVRLANVSALESQRADAQAALDGNADYQRLGAEIDEIKDKRDKLVKYLQLFVDGNIGPKQQRVERLEALIQTNEGTQGHVDELAAERRALASLLAEKRKGDDQVKAYEAQMEEKKAQRREMEQKVTDLSLQIKNLRAEVDKATGRLEQLEPGLAGTIGNFLRNQPLLDGFNSSIKIRQQLVPDVLTDVNLAQVPSLDRCMSCHVTIDNPLFTEDRVLHYLEFQALRGEFPEANRDRVMNLVQQRLEPDAMLPFWERTVENLPSQSGEPQTHLHEAQQSLIDAFALLYESLPPSDALRGAWKPSSDSGPSVTSMADVRGLRQALFNTWPSDWQKWYAPLENYRLTLGEIVDQFLDAGAKRRFLDAYRHALVDVYNSDATLSGGGRLSATRLILAHPRLDLFADPDSKHPIATMGCTSCHEGSGHETQFPHTAHTPEDMWVDAKSGMFVPEFLVRSTGPEAAILKQIRTGSSDRTVAAPQESPKVVLAGFSGEGAAEHEPEAGAESTAHGHAEMFHDRNWYAQSEKYEDPFGYPTEGHDVTSAAYVDPATGELARAVKQKQLWTDRYDWHSIPFHDWERPMHELKYVQSSCNRCHAQELELEESAPELARGRLMFAQLGCVDCHAVDSLGSPLRDQPGMPDIRQVGPSLVHVKEKLSQDMIASWTWAPKAFRPNTRMPHFFMTQNNSSPLDIRRTRAEVAAIADYLVKAPDDPTKQQYHPEALPPADTEGLNLAGDVETGRKLFKEVGCLSCHSNVNETGLEWVAIDLQERFGVNRNAALKRIAEDSVANEGMSGEETSEDNVGFFRLDGSGKPTPQIKPQQYTRLHWYLMHYQSDRYTRFAPELSGVATKLLYDRTPEQARAWLYDWLRNPTHYSDYTRMPRLRLTEQEAINLSAYLLSQKHPTYEPQHFDVDEKMVDALLINLQKNAISEAAARAKVAAMTLEEKQYDLGNRMIQHYGCFGCHEVSGFDSSLPVSANLTAYGAKDPHKLDFGYFEHIFDDKRPETVDVWYVEREGLTEDDVKVKGDPDDPRLSRRTLAWEHVENDRRGYIYAKLHNTRIFDRNKLTVEGDMTDSGEILYTDKSDRTMRLVEVNGHYLDASTRADSGLTDDQVEILNVGEPYLKLRMPRFFLRDSEIQDLVTYVTSLKPPLVRGKLTDTADEMAAMRAKGRLAVESFNCIGCHDVDNNVPNIRQYYEVRDAEGKVDFISTQETLPNAPPRIVGNGAKAQHEWFYGFLNNVEMLRPWLKIRMPSFNLQAQETQWLVEYLAGQTTMDARMIGAHLKPVDAALSAEFDKQYRASYQQAIQAGNNGAKADELAKAAAARAVGEMLLPEHFQKTREELVQTAREFGLYSAREYPSRTDSPDEFAFKNGRVWYDLHFLRNVYSGVDYPFQAPPVDNMSDEEFARGEGIVKQLGCFACHRLGDWTKLENIFEIQQQALLGDQPTGADEPDPYGEDPYGAAEEDPYGGDEQDPYGAAEEDPYGGGEADPYGGSSEPVHAPTLYDNISAPNLGLAYRRLQEDYVRQWLRKPDSIMPGTKMPSLFGKDGRVSAFAGIPGETRENLELLYGKTAEEQIDLIVRWIFAAGDRHYTVDEYVVDQAAKDPSATMFVDPLTAELETILARRKAAAAGQPQPEQPEKAPAQPEQPKVQQPKPAEQPEEKPKPEPAKVERLTPEQQAEDRESAVTEALTSADGATGTIAGIAVYDGPPRRRTRINLAADAFCIQSHRGQAAYSEEVVINGNGSLRDVVVYVRNAPKGSNPLDGPREIDQVGCIYTPHVTAVTTGTTLSIRNTDATAHNLKFTSVNNGSFNEGQPVAGMVKDVQFDRPELKMHLSCSVHNWMQAYIYAFDHPYHAVTDEHGVFKIAGLPPGDYEIVFDHADLGEKTVQVTVDAGKAARADATFSP